MRPNIEYLYRYLSFIGPVDILVTDQDNEEEDEWLTEL